jgi:hypothetical protein
LFVLCLGFEFDLGSVRTFFIGVRMFIHLVNFMVRKRVRMNLSLDPETVKVLKSRAHAEGRAVSRIIDDLVSVRTKHFEKKVEPSEPGLLVETLHYLEDIEARLDKISKFSEVEDINQ